MQLALLAVLALVGGFLLLKSKGGEETPATPPAATAPAEAGAATTGTVDPTTGLPVAAAATPTAATPTSQVPTDLIPGRGLPSDLMPAYRDGKAIVLLIRRAGGRDDALVRDSVDLLSGNSDLKVYVTRASDIARYAWLTQGVNVTELPALIILLPRKLTKGTPTATISYGFRDGKSVEQAVDDALYNGPKNRPYHP